MMHNDRLNFRVGFGGESTQHIAATQATGADVQPLGLTIDQNTYALHIGSPSAIGLTVGVANIVTAHHALLTYLTKMTHS